jgi:hypothetical protein
VDKSNKALQKVTNKRFSWFQHMDRKNGQDLEVWCVLNGLIVACCMVL